MTKPRQPIQITDLKQYRASKPKPSRIVQNFLNQEERDENGRVLFRAEQLVWETKLHWMSFFSLRNLLLLAVAIFVTFYGFRVLAVIIIIPLGLIAYFGGKFSLMHRLGSAAAAIILAALVFVVLSGSAQSMFFWIGVIVYAIWQAIGWWYTRFVITDQRIMLRSGIIAREVGEMPLDRVTDKKFTQSILGRWFKYGTFIIESAGQDQALRKVSDLPNPVDLIKLLNRYLYSDKVLHTEGRGE